MFDKNELLNKFSDTFFLKKEEMHQYFKENNFNDFNSSEIFDSSILSTLFILGTQAIKIKLQKSRTIKFFICIIYLC